MLAKTHVAVGIAAALAVGQPKDMTDLLIGTGAAAIGAVISDIDADSSRSHKEADIILGVAALFVLILCGAEYHFQLGLCRRLLDDTNVIRTMGAAAVFLTLCAFGKGTRHRTFMHSLPALGILTGCMAVFFPPACLYFAVAFASHILLDILNHKRVHILWPLGEGIALRWCSSQGWINALLFLLGALASAGMLLYFGLQIHPIA